MITIFRTEAVDSASFRFSLILDQGSQFTSQDFTKVLGDADVKISMDGKGVWRDKVFIERLWWSIKYECVYLNEFEGGASLKKGLKTWFNFYNSQRPHSSLEYKNPDQAYFGGLQKAA